MYRLLILCLSLLLSSPIGCASEPRAPRTVLEGSENRVFLILPLNVSTVMPRELESLAPVVWKELELYLREQDKQLRTVARPTARSLWLRSIRQARAEQPRAGYDAASRALTLELLKHAEFDAMIAPSLLVREAPISRRSARWDGVERELEFDVHGLRARRVLANTPLEGFAPAASLHVAVFDGEGDKIHEAQGGLDLLVRAEVRVSSTGDSATDADVAAAPTFRFATRTDLFANRAHLREGLNAAFAPFLPSLPE